MSELNSDKDVLEHRKNPLKDDPSKKLEVTASLRDRQLEKLALKLEELGVGQKVVNMWHSANADRAEYLQRQERYLQEIEEFIEPIYEPALEWSSTIHLPTILTLCKTFHGRMYAALLGIDPPFTMKGRRSEWQDRAMLATELMRYTLKDWINEYDGIDSVVDTWLWHWVTKGNGLLKGRWLKKFERFMDVDTQMVPDTELVLDEATGDSVERPTMREVQKEVNRTIVAFNGPMLEVKETEDVVIIGGGGDPQKADAVIEKGSYTASELWTFIDQKLFREEATRNAMENGRSAHASDQSARIKQIAQQQAGEGSVQKLNELDRYNVLEAYLKIDVDGSGISSNVIVWVHEETKEILRATYLRRVMPEGLVPFFKIGFHRRHGQQHDVGLVELLYSLGKEIDAQHNIKVDVGILSSLPIGFYRPTAASLKEEGIPIEPGALIPVDNPQTDIYFPNLGLRTSFGFQEEQALMMQIERLTSISDLNLGIQTGNQGAARTATGARALLGESSNNLSIYIQRMNRGWKRALNYTWAMLQHRLEPDFQFRVQGDDGNGYFKTVKTRDEIAGKFDFELEANSANSNKMIEVEQANMIYQMTQNPIDIQLGIVTPMERYEAIVRQLKVNGIKDVSKFARKPNYAPRALTPLEMADRVLHGMPIDIQATDDLEGYLKWLEYVMSDDEILGQFDQVQVRALVALGQQAQAMLAALQQAQAQQTAAAQQSMNSQAAMTPANNQPVAVNQPPPPGEGG